MLREETKSLMGISRRSFLKGATAVGALTAAGALAGCASLTSSSPSNEEGSSDSSTGPVIPTEIAETIETEIAIVGGGLSGLACAVQAGINGSQVILLEKSGSTGGNGAGVEGQFAVGSSLQKANGIEIEPEEIITAEHMRGQYRADGSLWMDLVTKSAGNIEWCMEQGVEYSGTVDNYYTGLYETFHWFKGGHASEGYIPQMTSRAEELNVDIRLSTSATALAIEDGIVTGVYASNSEGEAILVKAKAVVLATGGIGGNRDLIALQGWDTDNMLLTGSPGSVGDGYKMAAEAGAKDFIHESCQLIMNYIQALPTDTTPLYTDALNGVLGFSSGGPILWVNQESDRFINENVRMENMMLQSMAMRSNKDSYCVFDTAIYEKATAGIGGAKETLDKGAQTNEGNSLFKADTIAELAKAFDLPEEELVATVERYNKLCESGKDTDFGKDSENMIAIENGPFYIAKVSYNYLVGIGGITTNKRYEVVNDNLEAIPGLYSTGVDGVMLYRNIYTINMPGTACGNNINSGRGAANNAAQYLKS